MADRSHTVGSTTPKTGPVPERIPSEPVEVPADEDLGPRTLRLTEDVVTHEERLLERRNRLTAEE